MYDPSNDIALAADSPALNPTVTVGGDAPWFDKGLSALISLGSAFGAVKVQQSEISNAYALAALQRGVYAAPGNQFSGATPWLGITGPGAGTAPGTGTTGGTFGNVDPLMLILIVAAVGIGAVVLLRK